MWVTASESAAHAGCRQQGAARMHRPHGDDEVEEELDRREEGRGARERRSCTIYRYGP